MVSGRPYTQPKTGNGPKGPSFKRLPRKLARAMVACLPQAAPSFRAIARLPIVGSPSLPSWTDQTGGSLRYRTAATAYRPARGSGSPPPGDHCAKTGAGIFPANRQFAGSSGSLPVRQMPDGIVGNRRGGVGDQGNGRRYLSETLPQKTCHVKILLELWTS